MRSSRGLLAVLPVFLSLIATVKAQSCSATSQCPETSPCCSDFGFCGQGAFCLGGCDPFASYSVDSCMPEPVCQSANYTFSDLSRIQTNASAYNGDASKFDWVMDGGNVTNTNGSVAMILTESNGGTRLSSTRYVHYGTITARMKTGRWAGVVTAFITMSDIKDEIDWEWPGAAVTEGQTNWFWQGVIPTTTHGGITDGITNTYSNWHDYTIDWSPTALSWLVDGKVVRTIKASDSTVDGVSQFPSTPSRIEMSLWPAGISTSAPGTVTWAGGMINWQDPDYVANGNKFEALVSSVSVTCADPTPPSGNVSSYVYGTNASASTPSVAFSNKSTLLQVNTTNSNPTSNSSSHGGGSSSSSGGSSANSSGGSADASSSSSPSKGLSTRMIAVIVGSIIGGLAALVFLTLIVRTILFAFSKRGKNAGGAASAAGFGGQRYRPLEDPAPAAAEETHDMRDLP